MRKGIDEIELRSEEIQELLSKMPNWMVRNGNVLILAIVAIFLLMSWIIKYPDVITSKAVVTTMEPPQKIFARSTGKFDSIYVNKSEEVRKNSILATIQNSANNEDVYYLKAILDSVKTDIKKIDFPVFDIPILTLGDIEPSYSSFEKAYIEYSLYRKLLPLNNEVVAGKLSLQDLKTRLLNNEDRLQFKKDEVDLKVKDLERNKELLDKGVISKYHFESKQLELLNDKRELKSLQSDISQLNGLVANTQKDIRQVEISIQQQNVKMMRDTRQALSQLKKSIMDWEYKYVLKSSINGQVSFLNYWNKNQRVVKEEQIFTIIPTKRSDFVARLQVVPESSGKIKLNQRVHIMLENYPEEEFGIIEGQVMSISNSPDSEGNYYIEVNLPTNLITTYKKKIEFKGELSGTAEIITEDLRLLERFLYQLRALFN